MTQDQDDRLRALLLQWHGALPARDYLSMPSRAALYRMIREFIEREIEPFLR